MPAEPNAAGLRYQTPVPPDERLRHNPEFRHRHQFLDWLTGGKRGVQRLVPPWRSLLTYATEVGVIPEPTRGRPPAKRDKLLDDHFGPELVTLAKRMGSPASREDFAKRIYRIRDPHDPYVAPAPTEPDTPTPRYVPPPEPPVPVAETLEEMEQVDQSMNRDDFANWLTTKQQGRRYRPVELYREWRKPPPEKDHLLYEDVYLMKHKKATRDMHELLGAEFTRFMTAGLKRTPPEIIAKIEALRWTRMSSPSP